AENDQQKDSEPQSAVGDLNNFSHQENGDSTKNGDLNNFSHVTKESLENTKVFTIQNDFTYFSKYVGRSIPDLIIDFYNKYFKTTKYAKIELTRMCEEENTLLVFESIKRAIDGEPDKPIAYIKKTITNWNAANCETLEDIQKYEEKHRDKKKQNKTKGSYAPKNKSVRKEMVPEWVKEDREKEEQEKNDEYSHTPEKPELRNWDDLSPNFREVILTSIIKAINNNKTDEEISSVYSITLQDIAKLRKDEEDRKRLDEIKKNFKRD
ncbi:DnaD domain protein, partial [Bacillus cereus group sp. BfR-BA-01381]|uniref:DnaD domain protein n=1 Tax=Bacillus cereus group sp. BfR-BA-01381 TaxID=2920325 RepID=UPI001F56FE29